jgi:probable HAF family extracellular repeat protein
MKRYLCSLLALGLLQGVTGPVNAQPTYNFRTFDVPDSLFPEGTVASGINASGQIVGSSYGGSFLLDNGNSTTLEVPGSTTTRASGINDSGQIVGSYSDAAGTHGFLFDQGNYTTLDVPGATSTWASGINASGQIVGSYQVAGPYIPHGFLLDSGNFTTFDVPGSIETGANGINNSGQIVSL